MRNLFVFIICFLIVAIAAPVHASRVRTVEGIIQSVTDDSIQVRRKHYNVSGAPLKDPSGGHLKKGALTTGKKVEIFFEEDKITSILIYDDMVE